MIILPAIDLLDGKCVRLYKGDYSTASKVAEDPLEAALSFQNDGAQWLHVVDLDGAKSGQALNLEAILNIKYNTKLRLEVGGGIRNIETVSAYIEAGIDRVILGSSALEDPDFVKFAVDQYGNRIAVGIDAKNGYVSVRGWIHDSSVSYIDLAKSMEAIGVGNIIYTDISKDGTLQGPNFEELAEINNTVACKIIASGGISCIEDIRRLKTMELYGVICGKAIYSGDLSLTQALDVSQSREV
jgi:phosphoribosylformimino-5-aminoimidazole carboxamide ribotide isomerase